MAHHGDTSLLSNSHHETALSWAALPRPRPCLTRKLPSGLSQDGMKINTAAASWARPLPSGLHCRSCLSRCLSVRPPMALSSGYDIMKQIALVRS